MKEENERASEAAYEAQLKEKIKQKAEAERWGSPPSFFVTNYTDTRRDHRTSVT